MSGISRKFFARHILSTASVIGLGLCLTFAEAGLAQTGGTTGDGQNNGQSAETPACENDPQTDWLINPNDPGPSDARAILKLIHRYNWALDDHDFGQLDGLFIDQVFYELCDASGTQILKKIDRGQLDVYLNGVFDELEERGTQTRHVETNTLLNSVNPDTIQGKTTVLVTLQHPDIETPVLDYTGSLRTEFTRVGNVWLFSRITLITDGHKIEFRAR